MFLDCRIRHGSASLNLEPTKKHLREHFKGIPFTFPKYLALSAIGEIFDVFKLVFPDGSEVFEIHTEGVIFDEYPDVISLAQIDVTIAVESDCRCADMVNLGFWKVYGFESLQLSSHI